MKSKSIIFVLCFLTCVITAQQIPSFTQFTFNKAGLNPAASGIDNTLKVNYIFGLNRQWLGFDNAPMTNFLNLSYTIRPPRSYRYWQNAGIYFDSEDAGLMGSNGVYGSYTFHLLLQKTTTLSFGALAGARFFNRALYSFDQNDPAVKKSVVSLWVYPDIIPGIRITNKKYFAGLSLRQITIGSLKGYKGRRIGSPSILKPNVYIEAGKTIEVAEQVLMMPAMALNIPLIAPPTVDASLMFYIANRLGLGAAVRNTNFVSGIFQIRFLQNMTAGFAYSYPMNRTRYVAGSSYELMIGIIPMGMSNKLVGVSSIARCPTLSY